MKRFDVVVVGAGPGGCMTAKVLSENGLRVALLERKKDITTITRTCATMIAIEDERYFNERMYLNEKNNKIVFPETGFSVDYDGPHRSFYNWSLYSPDGRQCVQLGDYQARKNQGQRISATYSKPRLLNHLLTDARKNGCEFFPATNIVEVKRGSRSVRVYSGEGRVFEGTFVVAADGANSRIAQVTGINKKRFFYGTMTGVGLYINNFKIPTPDAFNWMVFYHHETRFPMAFTILPCPYPDAEFWLWGGFISSPPRANVDLLRDVKYIFTHSPSAPWFAEVEIARYNCHVLNMWSPAPSPFLDNIVFIGDAVWTLEAECTGAMMSGMKAAHAITTAFRENKLNREGVRSYLTWWERTFPQSEDYRGILSLFGIFEILEEEEVNYLFSLLAEKTLEPTLNPYRVQQVINGVLLQKFSQIQKERPQFLAKLQHAATLPIEKILAPSIRRAFPNN